MFGVNDLEQVSSLYCVFNIYEQWRQNEFESGGGGAKRRKKILSCPSACLALQVQLVVSVSAFVVVSTVWSVSSGCSSTQLKVPSVLSHL